MDDTNLTCTHKYPVVDEHEGTTVCSDCGLVLEKDLFLYPENQNKSEYDNCAHKTTNFNRNEALELLHRLNLPYEILNNLPNEKQNVDNLYDVINKTSVITTKEFCAASGIDSKTLVKKNQNKVMNTDIFLLLDKYCKLLNLTYHDYTLIKAVLMDRVESGHPPLTVIGYYIFTYCKKNKKRLSMKTICSTLSISPISIQRYRKHELSRRC